MRSKAPDLLPIFRSRHQADLLAWLYLHPEREFTATDLAQRLKVPLTTLHREVQRVVDAGLVQDRVVGRARLLRAASDQRVAAPLAQLLLLTFGPQSVIEEAFERLKGVKGLYIYGSWAARYAGVPGRPPGDVDVLVVGTPSRAEVYTASDEAQDRLGLQVNPTVRTVDQWVNSSDRLVQQIKASPLVTIRDAEVGDDGEESS